MLTKNVEYRFYSDSDRISRNGIRDACEAMLEAHANPVTEHEMNEQLHCRVSVILENNVLVGRV